MRWFDPNIKKLMDKRINDIINGISKSFDVKINIEWEDEENIPTINDKHCAKIVEKAAIKVLLEHGTTACTDITGFGLLGHLIEMIKASSVGVELDLEAIPILTGAIETIEMGIISSLYPQNLHVINLHSSLHEHCNQELD